MRSSYPIFETPIIFEEDEVSILVIENQKAFSEFVRAIFFKAQGADEPAVTLFKNLDEVKFDKLADVVTDIINIDCNNKKAISRLYNKLNEVAFQEDNYTLTLDIMSKISEYLLIITQSLPCGVDFDENVELSTLFKSVALKVSTDNKSVLERVCDYVEIMNEFCGTELFVFVGLKAFLMEEELVELYKFILYKKVNVLLVENVIRDKIENESIKIIDNDLCEVT